MHRCQDRLVEIVTQSTIFRHIHLCRRQIVSITLVKSYSDIFLTQDCDLIGHVLVSDTLSDVVRGIARLTSSENIGHISHISKIVRHCAFLPQYLDTLSHVIVEVCACFERADDFRHLDLIVLIFRLVHTSSLLVDHIGFCTDESVLIPTLPAFVIEIRSRVGLFAVGWMLIETSDQNFACSNCLSVV